MEKKMNGGKKILTDIIDEAFSHQENFHLGVCFSLSLIIATIQKEIQSEGYNALMAEVVSKAAQTIIGDRGAIIRAMAIDVMALSTLLAQDPDELLSILSETK